jgi:aminopeptidase N
MYVGTNERKYAFMDEGMAQMIPMAFTTREIQKNIKNYAADAWNNRAYEMKAGREKYDRPPAVNSYGLDPWSWHNINYERPGAAFLFLQEVLGEERYKTALRKFIRDWSYKHPTPYDFFNTINTAAGEDLSWFWNPWFFEFGYPDLAIREVQEEAGNMMVTIEKIGNIPVPVMLKIKFEDDSTTVVKQTARVWAAGNKTYKVKVGGEKKIRQVALDNRRVPDVDRSNNLFMVK